MGSCNFKYIWCILLTGILRSGGVCFFSLLTLKNTMLSLQTAAAETVHDSLWLVLNAK